MALVSLSDFTNKYVNQEGEAQVIYLESPATMDSNDTVDVTALMNNKILVDLSAWDVSAANGSTTVTATYARSTDVITVDASGGTTDSVYVIKITLIAGVATA